VVGALALGTTLSLGAPALVGAASSGPGGPAAGAPGGAAARLVSAQAREPLARAVRHRLSGRLIVKRLHHKALAGEAVHVRGVLLPRRRGRVVVIQSGVHHRWRAVARARTRANGHFDVRVVLSALGSEHLRARFFGDARARGDAAGAGTVRTFRATGASWYALYGGGLACGGTLGYDTLGVAHKTLPCGTRVTLRYNGREITVPVVDRGPYVAGREWDLTGATARALGFGGAGTIWSSR